MKIIGVVIIVVAVLLVVACQPVPKGSTVQVGGGSYQNVYPAELNTMLKSKDFILVNVHIPLAGSIADTDLSIPYDEIEQRASELPRDKNARIVLYCRSGHMSGIAAETLVKLGYTNVWSLQGGMQAWEQAGFPIQGP